MTTPRGRSRKYAFKPRVNGAASPTEKVQQVIGSSGLKTLGGRVQDEYDQMLKSWEEEVKFYIEMDDDLTISTLMAALTLPLLAAEFDVEPASDSMVDVAARDWLWDTMNNMDRQTWRSHVKDMLDAPKFGFALGEIVLDKRKDGRLWLKNIDPRGQETLNKWEFDSFDHATGFVQRNPNSGKLVTIPIAKTVHMTFGGRKGSPQGRGMFRTLFRTWRFLKGLENLEGIGLERNVGGMPVASLPAEPLDDNDIQALKDALRDLRLDEEMYLILPNGLTVSPYSGAINVAPMGVVINRKQTEILQLGFAQFIKLGMNQVGTQALVKGSQDFFTLGLEAIQQQMLEGWNMQLVPFLFRFNQFSFPGMTGFPKIVWHQPGKVDIATLLEAYNKALTAKVMTPLREDEEFFRAEMDLNDLPDGVGDDVRSVDAPAAPMFGDHQNPLAFAEGDPDKRSGGGDYEDTANRFQGTLLGIYDRWAIDTRNLILQAQQQGIQPERFSTIIAGRIQDLETNLITAQSAGITAAVGVALTAALRGRPSVQTAIATLSISAANGIRSGLTDSIQRRLDNKLAKAEQFDRSSLKTIFDSARASIAASSGLAWQGIFTALLAAGREQELQTGRTQRVRWVLNDAAEHCDDSAGHFGCPGLSGVYNSWAELPTVPAAQTTCRGNCRCRLEVETEPGSNVWVRGLPDVEF